MVYTKPYTQARLAICDPDVSLQVKAVLKGVSILPLGAVQV